jgi:hypothetical protein
MRKRLLAILALLGIGTAAFAAGTTVSDLTVVETIYQHPIRNARWQAWMNENCPSNRWVLQGDQLVCVEVDIYETGTVRSITQ